MKFSIKNSVKVFFVLVALSVAFNCHAKKEVVALDTLTAKSVFSSLNENSLDLLPRSTRLDMLDYYDVDSIYKARNLMGGLSELEIVTPSFLKVKISEVSNLQIKILPSKKYGILVMTIYTVGAPGKVTDSQVNFYDNNLHKLKTDLFLEIPKLKEFFEIPKGSLTKMKDIEEIVPFPTVEYVANKINDSIDAKLTVGEAMNIEDNKIIQLFLMPKITFDWNGEKYKLKK